MRITPENSILLAIDYQEKLMPVMSDKENVIKKSQTLINGVKALDIPVIVSQQYTKGLGETIPEITECIGDFTPFEKTTFSCYSDEQIRMALRQSNKNTVIICGVESHVCVMQTVIDLIANEYNVVLVEDCVSSRYKEDKDIAIKRVMQEGALIASCESILFELTYSAKNPNFKTISKLVK